MPHMPPRRRSICQRAVASVVEALEHRTLLTTVMGGGINPVTGEALANTVRYKDAKGHIVQISVGGETTAEFISGRVNKFNRVVLGDLTPPNTADEDAADLFHIYVSESDSRSFITVTEINPTNGALLPFAGNAGPFRVRNAVNGRSVVVTPDGPGTIILGARTKDVSPAPNDEDIAIVSRSISGAFGVRPDLGPRITAGFQVAPGHDFGKFFFAGVVTGQVTVPGTIGNIYAGNVWTGDARGLAVGANSINFRGKKSPNFDIGGNLHSLLVGGSVGTDDDAGLNRPTLVTGFVAQIGGIVGELNTRHDWVGAVNVLHGRAATEFGSTVEEVEGRNSASDVPTDASGWTRGFLEGDASVFNDSFGTPQVLPSFIGRRGHSSVAVSGQLVADTTTQDRVDYYAIPMLAGQDLTITLQPVGGVVAGTSLINVGVFDPDGRLILTDYPNVDFTQVTGQPVHFTADRPGLYRIAVAGFGDGDFNGTAGLFRGNVGFNPYTLSITGGGDLGLGAVVATENIFDNQSSGFGYFVQNGDMGGLQAGGSIISLTDQTVNVRKGNLRSIEGGELGRLQGATISLGPNLFVARGNVGLVRSTNGIVDLNNGAFVPPVAGDYQIVQSATTMLVTLLADRGIGVIRAGDFATRTPSVISVNADQEGDDGVIDLIDCAGDFGTLNGGGPAITTGPGGNVRYINVGGEVFRDAFFGGGAQEATVYDPGETVKITDDSGTEMEFEPFPTTRNPLFVPGGTNPALIGPTLSLTGYGIRGSGGLAVINLTSSGSVRIGAGGRRGSRSHAEIGRLETTGVGNPVITSTNSGTLVFSSPTTGTAARNLDILIEGSATVDVFKIQGSDFTSIRNSTPGEILNIDATVRPTLPPGATNNGTIGSLTATNIGVGVNHTGAAVNGLQTISNAYPFNQQHNGVVSGNILNVEAAGAVGNLNVTGSIGSVAANSGRRNTTRTFEGIAGPIVATQDIAAVNIGEGILPSGNGNVAKAGLYAGNRMGTVRNQGLGSDVRGDIVAGTSIDRVALTDGAIIGNKILVVSQFDMARRFREVRFLPDGNDTTTNPVFEIGSVSASGQGGIIGSDIAAADVGDISSSGFGILNTSISDLGDGTINSISADGYGVRQVEANGGALLNSVKAGARPRNVSVLSYTPSVRQSERRDIDPFFDQAPSAETDLHLFLGTSARKPKVTGVTDTGVIADSIFTANRNAGSIFAATIRTSQFNIANQINSIETRGLVSGLLITTGRLKSYFSGGDSEGLNFQVAGTIDKMHVAGAYDATSVVQALGGSARIIEFIVDGSLDGDVTSSGNLHLLEIGKDLGPTALVKAKTLDEKVIKGGIFGTIQIG